MASINGKDVVIELSTDAGTTYKTLVCEISNGLSIPREITSTTTKCSGGTTIRSAGAYSWEVSGEAVVETAPAGTAISYEDLLSAHIAGTLMYVKIQSPLATGTDFYHQGSGYFSSFELSNPVDGESRFTFTLSGSGALDITA